MTPPMQAAQWAAMPPAIWLASAAGPDRHDVVVRWGWDPGWLASLPCGVRWDAVRMDEAPGLAVLAALRSTDALPVLGPVLHHRGAGHVYWLVSIEADGPADWREIDPTCVLFGAGSHLALPTLDPELPQECPEQWIHRPRVVGTLTPPSLLRAGVEAAR
ncbi:hypothetical protein LN042_04865 [Kitasatospora sp. RB6PN24]|uniref:hypothetical protein n=1 Tax=Kitasatospora humi TaxID=2893891 RepID=UPI001E3E4B1D|nr:hypothetical protein [Kitasatospora humi]MCC9306446.1 hypothetical protein [Kitasatospora humi]